MRPLATAANATTSDICPPISAWHPAASAPGPSGAVTLQFSDVEEQASALNGWNQDYLQLSAGAFHGEICQVQGPGVRLFIEQLQQSVYQTGGLDRDVLAIGVPLHAQGSSVFCGQPCGVDGLHVFSGNTGFEFRSASQHTMLGIELQLGLDWLEESSGSIPLPPYRGRDLRGMLPAHLQSCVVGATPLAVDNVRAYLLSLLQAARARPGLLSNPAVVASVADHLVDALEHAHQLRTRQDVSRLCTHWQLVQRACNSAHDQLEQAPTVAQLCVELGVSRRTLQNGFQQVLDVSPLTYLKAVRLRQVRRALKAARSVTEAATRFGFWHFGHFAQDYQVMFGELPSDTLRRHDPNHAPSNPVQ